MWVLIIRAARGNQCAPQTASPQIKGQSLCNQRGKTQVQQTIQASLEPSGSQSAVGAWHSKSGRTVSQPQATWQ